MNKTAPQRKKVVLLYSGGVDTSISVRLLQEKYNFDVITCTVDLGQREYDFEQRKNKALALGAVEHVLVDGKEEFANKFVLRALQANALYDGSYPVSTSLSRPFIARKAVEIAKLKGAEAIAHGCKGRGADAFRLNMVFKFLASDLELVMPIGDWNPTREEEVQYAQQHRIPIPVTTEEPYSYDDNLWGNAVNYGSIDNIENRVPESAYRWTSPIERTPQEREEVTITFEKGVPAKLNEEKLGFIEIVQRLNTIAGRHGIGRIDMIENGLYGNKFRWVYECPGAQVLIRAHQEIEKVVLPKETIYFKETIDRKWAIAAYNSFLYSPLMEALSAFVISLQKYVTGSVTFSLHRGNATVLSRSAPNSLVKSIRRESMDLVPYGYEEYLFASVNSNAVERALNGFQD